MMLPKGRRIPHWLIPAVCGAVLVNVALFSLVTLLSSERRPPQDEIQASSVSLVSLAPPEPPVPEEVKEPEPPEPEQDVDFKPDLKPPDLDLGVPGLPGGMAVDLGLGRMDSGLVGDAVFNSYELDTQPQTLVRMQPPYPTRASERGIEGVVQVKLLVNQDGSVGRVEILKANPEGIFEDTVRRTVPKWKFKPGRISGEAVTAWVVTNVRFKLN